MLENHKQKSILAPFPDEKDFRPSDASESHGLRLSPSPLESAINDSGGNARTTGEESFGQRREAAIAQREALIRWTEANGLKVDPFLWEEKAALRGSEHDIREVGGEMWKVTRPDHFGWTVLPSDGGYPEIAEATPLEYLERWQNANAVLGDLARLRGIDGLTQIMHPVGEAAANLRNAGFKLFVGILY